MNGVIAGRIVHYVLTEKDVNQINESRSTTADTTGIQMHKGNHVTPGEHVPAMIVKVFENEFGNDNPGVNLQCFLDGNDSHWVTSRKFSESGDPGTWHWIEKA